VFKSVFLVAKSDIVELYSCRYGVALILPLTPEYMKVLQYFLCFLVSFQYGIVLFLLYFLYYRCVG
jgi:hypothetical protein